MGNDDGGVTVRERVWVEVFDHTVEPARPVKMMLIENGEVKRVEEIPALETQEEEETDGQ